MEKEQSQKWESFKAYQIKLRSSECTACGKTPCDIAHIKSRGAGGYDHKWNLMPLCRGCHITQHNIGWRRFSDRFYHVAEYLKNNGWVFIGEKETKLIHLKSET